MRILWEKFTFQKLNVIEDEHLIPDFDVQYFETDVVQLLAENFKRLLLEVIRADEMLDVAHVLGILLHPRQVQINVENGIRGEESQQASSIWL